MSRMMRLVLQGCRRGVADDVGERLLDERRVRVHERQIGQELHVNDVIGAGGGRWPRRALRSRRDLPSRGAAPVTGVDARDHEQVAHHLVQAFGFALDVTEQVPLRLRVELSANSSSVLAEPRIEARGVRKS